MQDATNTTQPIEKSGDLKNWTMLVVTFIFVFLYAAALTGWLRPLSDITMITRLEPIIFVIIGYYFGRLPAIQNEKTLKEEIDRQTQKATAAQHTKEKAQQEREVLEERIKSVRTTLVTGIEPISRKSTTSSVINENNETTKHELLNHSVFMAIKILNS